MLGDGSFCRLALAGSQQLGLLLWGTHAVHVIQPCALLPLLRTAALHQLSAALPHLIFAKPSPCRAVRERFQRPLLVPNLQLSHP